MANELLQNPSAWLSTLSGSAQNKIGFNVLDWVNKSTGGQNPPPGANKQETSPNDFVGYLKNGVQLCKLANFLQPGAIGGINEQAQTPEASSSNINKFLGFAKNIAGIGGGNLFQPSDLSSPKGVPAILGTLLNLGTNAGQNFGKSGLNVNTLLSLAAASQGGAGGIVSQIFGRCCGKK
uniref:Calponin-homology (CH) domain-containing protein n=1 Tax=Romanomermis culicivorax TaxID=13658 RepID=A0A915J8I6_ROMCU